MNNSPRFLPLICLLLAAAGLILIVRFASAYPQADISGVVVDEAGAPVAGATVRIQTTTNSTTSHLDGSFTLQGLSEGVPVTVSAWKDLYYCAKVEGVLPPASPVTLTLRLYQTNDNPAYVWEPPTGAISCYSCKVGVTQIWLDNDAHGRSGSNPRFLSLYNATDITGTAIITPGYQLDFPGTAGNCATCHAAGAALDAPFTTNMNTLPELDQNFGIHCDFCHKVADVYLNPSNGLPYNNAPGVISMDVRRPFTDTQNFQLFFGTFDDDNVPEEDTYLPLIEKSQWCASCHQFSFWGVPIYQSFKEWLVSPYPSLGIECQTCHMPSDGVLTNVAPGAGGLERDPLTIHAHTFPGAASEALLQNTVLLTATTQLELNSLQVSLTLTNTEAGHHVPTDFPGRQMLLLVEAHDSQANHLPLLSGSTIPTWGGEQASLPGKVYAKILQDVVSNEYPVVSYWKQTRLLSDNRLAAFESDSSSYLFALPPASQPVTVTVRLLFRRSFIEDMDARGWGMADILMEEITVPVSIPPSWHVYLPLMIE